MRRSPYHSPAQLVLYPETKITDNPLALNPKGLVEALADLLLAATGVQGPVARGGDDER